VIPPLDPRLTDLFVRYWDNALSPSEADDLRQRLAADPAAREAFQFLSFQAVTAADGPMAGPAAVSASRGWSRRRVLGYLTGGVAASVLATVLGRRYWPDEPVPMVRLAASNGEVTLRTPDGRNLPADGLVPPGGMVSTVGPSSSALLTYPDGTDISLSGDSVVMLSGHGRKLSLLRGTATADVRPQTADAEPLTLTTTEATLTRLSAVVLTLGRAVQTTEVGVQTGRVSVADSSGEPLEVVHGGECLTVQADGSHRKQPIGPTPAEFAWDLSRPLPEGWNVGRRDDEEAGPVVRPVLWFDPYHKAEMYQIRSDHQWARGFFRTLPDTTFRVKYWIDRPGPSQLCVCVRTNRLNCSDTGMMECNGAFAKARPKEWQWLEVRAADMLENKHTPKFKAPWVGFLVILNTYKEDLGLKIAEFRVGAPGRSA